MEETYKINGAPSQATMQELSFLSFDQIKFIKKNVKSDGDLEDYLNELRLGKFKVLYEPYFDEGRTGQTYVLRVWHESDNMSYADAMVEVQRALIGYVEDSAGAESEESKTIESAWQRIQKQLSLLDEALDNAYFFVNYVEQIRENGTECRLIEDRANEEGTGGIMELCKELSIGFTEKYFYHQFDGDFDDKIEEYIRETNRRYLNTL